MNNMRIIRRTGLLHLLLITTCETLIACCGFSIMSHLNYSNTKSQLYQINISSFDMIRPSSSVSPLQGSSLVPDFSLFGRQDLSLTQKHRLDPVSRAEASCHMLFNKTHLKHATFIAISRKTLPKTTVANSSAAFTRNQCHL